MPDFIFLRETGESANDAVARCAEQALHLGPMSRTIRSADYRSFLAAGFAVDTPQAPVFSSGGTHCAIFSRCCLSAAGVLPRGKRPRVTGITTWLGVGWFLRGEWIPAAELTPQRGDVFYICSGSAGSWQSARDGHVGILIEGDGWTWRTAEGGGGADGSLCRLGSTRKDIRKMGRVLRGVWRPSLLEGKRQPIETADTDPAPPPSTRPSSVPPPADVWVPLKRNDQGERVALWQLRLRAAGYELPKTFKRGGPDRDFGDETESATRATQRDHLLPQTGVVDRATWETCKA